MVLTDTNSATISNVTMTTELTAADRCDRCGAQAYIRATLNSGDLLLCGHHYKRGADKLHQTAIFVHNELDKLLSR